MIDIITHTDVKLKLEKKTWILSQLFCDFFLFDFLLQGKLRLLFYYYSTT